MCFAGAQSESLSKLFIIEIRDRNTDGIQLWVARLLCLDEGKKCNYFKLLDMKGEKRGPCIGDLE